MPRTTTTTHSITTEDYLKALHLLQQRESKRDPIPLGLLAETLSLTPGTVTTMVKRFADDGLMRYTPRRGARLTAKGKRIALDVLRRHRIIETFLVEVLGLDWSEVHDEAEVLEHAISDKVLTRIDAMLGHPTADPHGSPIPPAPGSRPRQTIIMRPLTDCQPRQCVTVGRLLDTQPAFLQFIEKHNLTPGTKLTITANDPAADAITIKVGCAVPTTLGSAAAGKILVTDN